jgi:hypothetical protein
MSETDNIADISKLIHERPTRPQSPTVSRNKHEQKLPNYDDDDDDETPEIMRKVKGPWPEFPKWIEEKLTPEKELWVMMHVLGLSTERSNELKMQLDLENYYKKLQILHHYFEEGEGTKSPRVSAKLKEVQNLKTDILKQVASSNKNELQRFL